MVGVTITRTCAAVIFVALAVAGCSTAAPKTSGDRPASTTPVASPSPTASSDLEEIRQRLNLPADMPPACVVRWGIYSHDELIAGRVTADEHFAAVDACEATGYVE